jgi:S-DNA-T family DNA segregation ATPase FtsK/SpoIIIE
LEHLTDFRGDIHATWKPAQLTAALSTHGIEVGQVGRRIDGKTANRRGPSRAGIDSAITEGKWNLVGK